MFGRLQLLSEMTFGSSPARLRTSLAAKILAGDFPAARELDGLVEDSVFSDFIDIKAAVDAKLVAAETVCKVGVRVFMSEYTKFTDYHEGEEAVRWGVGIRFVFTVESLDMSIKANTLAGLAAAAELGVARVGCAFKVIGIQGPAALKLFPRTLDTLDVQGLPKVVEALDGVRSLIYRSDGISIKPHLLLESTAGPLAATLSHSSELGLMVLALQCVANGYTLNDARAELVKRRKLPSEQLALIEAIYNGHVKSQNADERPTKDECFAAKTLLLEA